MQKIWLLNNTDRTKSLGFNKYHLLNKYLPLSKAIKGDSFLLSSLFPPASRNSFWCFQAVIIQEKKKKNYSVPLYFHSFIIKTGRIL